jgi:hypothetical protein
MEDVAHCPQADDEQAVLGLAVQTLIFSHA